MGLSVLELRICNEGRTQSTAVLFALYIKKCCKNLSDLPGGILVPEGGWGRLHRSGTLALKKQNQNPKQVLKYTESVRVTGNLPGAELGYVTVLNYKLASNSRWVNGSHHAMDRENELKLKAGTCEVRGISAGQVSTTEGSNCMRVPGDQMCNVVKNSAEIH